MTSPAILAPLSLFAQSVAAPCSSPLSPRGDALFTSEDNSPHQATFSLSDFEQIALENNPSLATALARINSARGAQLQAGLYPNPVVGYHATEIGNRDTAGQQGGFVSQRFVTAGKLGLNQAMAGKRIDEAHFQFHAQQAKVLSDVRVRFHDARIAQRRVELTEELASIGRELVRATLTLIEGRQASQNDRLQAEIKADESEILRENARNEHFAAWRRLVAVAGMPSMRLAVLSGQPDAELPSYDWEVCYDMVLSGNPALSAARMRVQRARIAVQRARVESVPDVDLFVSIRHNNITGSDNANVQVGIPVPVFDKNQGNVRSAQAEWVAACHDVKRIELDLQDRLAAAYGRYANARQQVDRYRQSILPRAQRSLDLVTDGYQQGQLEYLSLLTAQQTYTQVNLSYLNALQELRASSSIIEGKLLAGSLTEDN